MRSWRVRVRDEVTLDEIWRTPRVMFVTFHGMLLQLLAFSHLARLHGRQFVVLLSPSLDGQLLAAALRHFGVDHVYVGAREPGVTRTQQFIRRVRDGNVGVIAVDGPLGPCGLVKPGFVGVAAAADAAVAAAASWAGCSIGFRSWDHARLPLPFSRVEVRLQLWPASGIAEDPELLGQVQQALAATQRETR